MSEHLQVLLQHLLPKQVLTSLARRIAGARAGSVTTRLIRWVVKKHGVDMTEAANADIASYKSFNDFFTRPLRIGARPFARADFNMPCDGILTRMIYVPGALFSVNPVTARGCPICLRAMSGWCAFWNPWYKARL